jgi:hypothetical protein
VKQKTLGIIILIDLVLLIGWLAIMIVMGASGQMPVDFWEAVSFAGEEHWLFYKLNYANASLYAILNGVVFAGLYAMLKRDGPGWAEVGILLVPVIVFINLFSYLSQLVVVPGLVELAMGRPGQNPAAELLLRNLLQTSPDSALLYFDQFGYFLLSVPSIIFGVLLYRRGKPHRVGGALLALSGVFCAPVGFGVLAGIEWMISAPSMIGGVLMMVAFGFIGVTLLRDVPEQVLGL